MSGIQLLASLLIVAASPAAPIDTASIDNRLPDAVTLMECGFEPDRDLGGDDLPPGWSRQRGPGYPAWLPAALCSEPTPHGQGCLRLAVNGGRIVVHSPLLEASQAAKFAAQVEVRTRGLNRDSALLSLSFLDAEGKTLETVTSEGTSTAREWTRLRVAPVAPQHAATRFVRLSLHLEPRDPTSLPDFHGEALFDRAWLGRLPRVRLEVSATGHLATTGDEASLTCVISNWPSAPPQPDLTVIDAYGQPAPEMLQEFTLVSQPASPPSESGRRECHWQVKLDRPGYYRARVSARGPSGAMHVAEVPLAVVDPREATEYNEFGWTLADGERDIPLAQLPRLLRLGGVGRLKFPAWTAAKDHVRLDELTRLADALRRNGVTIVGLLHRPPADVLAKLPADGPLLAARTFQLSPDVWYPSVAEMQARLGLDIRAWQLGDDRDTSFVGFPNLPEKLTEIRRELNRLGQDVTLGVAWKWSESTPTSGVAATQGLGLPVLASPLQFVSMTSQPPLTADELSQKLSAARGTQPARWVTLSPLDRDTNPLDARVSDLVGRMIAAKVHNVAAVFVSDPLNPRHGLVRPDGVPEELFVPWRTTAANLAGAELLGSLTLPGGSRNEVFAHKGRVTMVVWSDRPRLEVLELGPGEDVRQTDVWGLSEPLTHAAAGHAIDVGKLPSFVTGAHESLTRMRLAVSLASPRMPSRFGVRQQNAIHVKNTFPCGIAGSIRIVPPEGWRARPDKIDLQLSEGGSATLPLELNVPLSGETGKSKLRLDFELTADRRYTFSAWQNIEVGEPDLHLDVSTSRTAAGTIEVVQRLVNETAGPVSFRSFLYVPGQRRQRHEVLHLAPGTDTFVFHVDGGDALRGQTLWLRVEEINGQRVLSHRFEVE